MTPRSRLVAAACALATAVALTGCDLMPNSLEVVTAPSTGVAVETAQTTPSIAPYRVDSGRPASTASRPTAGSGFATFAGRYGVVAAVCTLGFFARYPDGHVVVFTAGHCANLAREAQPDSPPVARYLSGDGYSVPFGEYIKAVSRPTGQDLAMIQTVNARVQPVARAVGPVRGYSTAADLTTGNPQICIVGSRTGLHCGVLTYVSAVRVDWAGIPAVEGDSGGPVYAKWDDGSYTAVGVVNGVATRRDGMGTGRGTGSLIANDITVNHLTLLGTR